MARTRATSDLHLSATTAALVFAALHRLQQDAEATGGGVTVITGDVWNQARSLDTGLLNQFKEALHRIPGAIFIVPGNHDQYHGYRNALEVLHGGNIYVATIPCSTPIGLLVPHTPAAGFEAALKEAAANRVQTVLGKVGKGARGVSAPNVLWAHQGWAGAYQNGMRRDRTGVSCRHAAAYDLVVTGHYHMPQILGNILYVGSAYQTTFAQERQKHGWLLWEDPTVELLPVRVAYDIGAPEHHSIYWDPRVGPPAVIPECRPGDKRRLVTPVGKDLIRRHGDQLVAVGLADLQVVPLAMASPLVRADVAIGGRASMGSLGHSLEAYMTNYVTSDDSRPEPEQMEGVARKEGLWPA